MLASLLAVFGVAWLLPAAAQANVPFSPSSFWNVSLAANVPVDPTSPALMSTFQSYLNAEEAAKNGPWINSGNMSTAIVTVPANQPTVQVKLDHNPPDPALAAAWAAVPLPDNAQPSAGEDDLALFQPSTDRMWEFWHLTKQADGWHARWGGAMQNVSTNPGVYGPEAWPGAEDLWGVTATSFPIAAGVMTSDELASGQINHALAMALPDVRAGVFSSPAKRTDGPAQDPTALPEGAILRIDPNLDLSKLNMPPLTRMMAIAAQKYGIVIRDYAANITFYAEDPTATGSTVLKNLYAGSFPNQLLASFPWSSLQVLKMNLMSHRPRPQSLYSPGRCLPPLSAGRHVLLGRSRVIVQCRMASLFER